jgi:putative ABC transport system permease protein
MTGGWKLAARNLARHRRRNRVTGAAIALGYAGLVLLGGYAIRIERLLRTGSVYLQHRGHVAVYAKGGLARAEAKPSAYALAPAAQETIAAALGADPRVELVGRFLQGSGIAGNGCQSFPFRAVGVEPEVERRIRSHPEVLRSVADVIQPRAGRALPDAAEVENGVMTAVNLSRYLGKSDALSTRGGLPAPPGALDCKDPALPARLAADPFIQLAVRTYDGSFAATDAQIVGIFQAATTEADKTAVLAALPALQKLYDTDRVSYVAAFLRDHRETAAVARDLAARLAAAGLEVDVHTYDDRAANPYYVGTMGFLRALVGFIVVLVANVVGLSVLNAMTLTVIERTREMGTFRSLGFTRRELAGLFLREAVLLTIVSVAAGLAIALGVSGIVNGADVRFEPPGVGGRIRFLITPDALTCAAAAALFVVLSLVATYAAVRRKVRERVATLIAEVAA